MDKSKYFSSVHGERAPNDPHAGVSFYQDELPFDGEGLLMVDLVPEHKRELVARRLKKLNGAPPEPKPVIPTAVIADDDEDEDDDGGEGEPGSGDGDTDKVTPGEVNLEAWLRGEANYVWFSIPAAIRAQFSKNVVTKTDAVTFLVEEEKIVTPAQLAEALQPHYVPTKV